MNSVYNDLDLETREILPEKASLMRHASEIQNGTKDKIPPHPKVLAELIIPEKWQKICPENSIFYDSIADSEDNRIILFTSESNLNMLNDCKIIAGDGTFKVPANLRQIR